MSDFQPSVMVQLHGGLGNQMFQAAAGLALSKRLDLPLVFDLSRFRANWQKAYALDVFDLGATTLADVQPSFFQRATRSLQKVLGQSTVRVPAGWNGEVYSEPHFHFDPAFDVINEPVLLAGYFQSPLYFKDFEAGIRQAFDASGKVSTKALDLAELIKHQNSLAVHVRRGDMASDPKMAAVHGTVGTAYYDAAVAKVQDAAPDIKIFVFSDDASVADEFAEKYNGEALRGDSALDDMWLMSQCNHHIIANSSFSWWSAFLDPRPEGLRIAPKQWFTIAELAKVNMDDLVPSWWFSM